MYQERNNTIKEVCDELALIGLVAPPQMWVLVSLRCWIKVLGLKALSRVFRLRLLWSQVLNPVSTLPGPCPWNWNFLVYHRVPFQQARTQLSFNHSPRSYRCVWSEYKVSISWFDTQGTFCLSLAVHMKYFQGKKSDGISDKDECHPRIILVYIWLFVAFRLNK